MLGRDHDARQLLDRLLGLRNDLGLLSEEYDPVAGRLVGNFPQAFSHVSLVNSASKIGGDEKPTPSHVIAGLARRALTEGKSGPARHLGGLQRPDRVVGLVDSGPSAAAREAAHVMQGGDRHRRPGDRRRPGGRATGRPGAGQHGPAAKKRPRATGQPATSRRPPRRPPRPTASNDQTGHGAGRPRARTAPEGGRSRRRPRQATAAKKAKATKQAKKAKPRRGDQETGEGDERGSGAGPRVGRRPWPGAKAPAKRRVAGSGHAGATSRSVDGCRGERSATGTGRTGERRRRRSPIRSTPTTPKRSPAPARPWPKGSSSWTPSSGDGSG